MKKIIAMASVTLVLNACGNKEREYDATGVFEATETTVYAEQTGALLMFNVEEGDTVGRNKEVGLIDTTQLWLKIQQTEAMKSVYQSQKPEQEKQIAVTRRQLAKAKQDQQRYKELVADGAAPGKMLDDANSQVEVLQRQLDAQLSSLRVNTNTLDKQMAAADVQADQLRDQLRKCHILVPAKGTVIEKYVERGEFVSAGKPLFRMADTENMLIRAYVSSAQLKKIKTGQKATVFADYGNGEKKE